MKPIPARAAAVLTQLAGVAVLLLPLALLHARALAEILIGVIDALFLFQAALAGDRSWLRLPFARAALGWWLWQIVCSAAGTGGLLLALVAFRLPLLAVALGVWLLREIGLRRALVGTVAAAAIWIVIECLQQQITGTNLFGAPRFADGALTGPFVRPRAGPALILILFPVLVPAASACLGLPRRRARVAGLAACAAGALTVLLIGQRMPAALLMLGLVLTACLSPRLRPGIAAVAAAGLVLVTITPLVAPGTYHKLVLQTRAQLSHFTASPYAEIWVRAAVIAGQHPWLGLGTDGFRRGCGDPGAIEGLPALGVTLEDARAATAACNIHPHNYYLEQADNGGLPLLAAFCAMVGAAWLMLARGLRRGLSPGRTGLLVGYTLAIWPAASTSAFAAMPNAGWIFLLLGLGMAEAFAACGPAVRLPGAPSAMA